ncbi:MAG: SIMPL domain-containing protein [Rikenellaceae bacterium]
MLIKKSVIVLFAAFLVAYSAVAQSQNIEPNSSIEVLGQAKRLVSPDVAYINIVVDENDAATRSAGGVEKVEQKLVSTLKKLGLNPDENLSVNGMDSDFIRRKKSVSSKSYTLKLLELKKSAPLFAALEKEGISNAKITSYEVLDRDKIYLELKAQAVRNAKETAAILAEAADAKIGKIITITDTQRIYSPNIMYTKARVANSSDSMAENAVEQSDVDFVKQEFEVYVGTKWAVSFKE